MSKALDLSGPVLGESTFSDNKLIARDLAIKLPEVTLLTSEYNVGGKMETPIPGQTENMESSITYIGLDYGITDLIRLGKLNIEHRFVINALDGNGNEKKIGGKAFLGLVAKGIPPFEITVGERLESEISYTALRYRLILDGKEVLNVDKIARKLVVGGVDYYQSIDSYL
jgi:P2 family phage contractile tail tube protein